jgi:hypothetical protein
MHWFSNASSDVSDSSDDDFEEILSTTLLGLINQYSVVAYEPIMEIPPTPSRLHIRIANFGDTEIKRIYHLSAQNLTELKYYLRIPDVVIVGKGKLHSSLVNADDVINVTCV